MSPSSPLDLARRRLDAQRVTATRLPHPADVVTWLGAVQAQDYLGALWAIGLRTRRATEADVERAIAERAIVRTWPMRGTLHFVPAPDARWMLAVVAPRIIAREAARMRQLGLDDAVLGRSRDLVAAALGGGRRRSRAGIYEALRAGRVSTAGQRGIHVLRRLAQEGLICEAGRDGKQQTFALLDEWVPRSRTLARDEALAELATRYFTGHGPATFQDFTWWTGLASAEAREALELARPGLARDVLGGREAWHSGAVRSRRAAAPRRAVLLPAFDELLVGYRDRSAVLDPSRAPRLHALLTPAILMGGRVVGTWTRSLVRSSVVVRTALFEPPARAQARALADAAEEYGRFLGLRAVVA